MLGIPCRTQEVRPMRTYFTALVIILVALACIILPAIGFIATDLQAASVSSSATDLRNAIVHQLASRRPSLRNGKRFKAPRHHRNGNGASGDYEHDSNKLPFGTQRGWDQMLRENRAGTCCD